MPGRVRAPCPQLPGSAWRAPWEAARIQEAAPGSTGTRPLTTVHAARFLSTGIWEDKLKAAAKGTVGKSVTDR